MNIFSEHNTEAERIFTPARVNYEIKVCCIKSFSKEIFRLVHCKETVQKTTNLFYFITLKTIFTNNRKKFQQEEKFPLASNKTHMHTSL